MRLSGGWLRKFRDWLGSKDHQRPGWICPHWPAAIRFRPGDSLNLRLFLGNVALGHVHPLDLLQPDPGPKPTHEIVHRRTWCHAVHRIPCSAKVPTVLSIMDRLSDMRLKAQHIDAGASVDLREFHQQERLQPVRTGCRSGQPDLYPLPTVVAAQEIKAQPPCAPPPSGQPLLKCGQQPVEPRDYVLLQPDRIRQAEAHRKDIRRLCRGDRLGDDTHRLVEAQNQLFAKATRKGCAGLTGELIDSAQAKAGELGDDLTG